MIFDWFSTGTWDFNSEHDWESLKKQGTVTENIEETKKRLMEIEKEIKIAKKKKNYKRATKLKKKKEQLTKTKKSKK